MTESQSDASDEQEERPVLISRRVLIALGAMLVACVGIIFVIGASETSRLAAKSERLARAAGFERTRENPADRRQRLSRELDELASDGLALHLPELGESVQGKRALLELGGDLSEVSRIELGLSSISTEIAGEADAIVRATADSVMVSRGREQRERRRVTLRWLKKARQWRVTDIQVAPRSHEEPEARP